MQAKQRIVLSVSERDAFWEIEVERSGVWHSTIYAGTCPTAPAQGRRMTWVARNTVTLAMRSCFTAGVKGPGPKVIPGPSIPNRLVMRRIGRSR